MDQEQEPEYIYLEDGTGAGAAAGRAAGLLPVKVVQGGGLGQTLPTHQQPRLQ